MSDADRASFKERVRSSVEAVKSGQIYGWDVAIEWAEIEAEAERLAEQGSAGSRSTA